MIFIDIAIKLISGIKIPKDTLLKIVNEADTDRDGYISLGEVFYFIKNRATAIKEKTV